MLDYREREYYTWKFWANACIGRDKAGIPLVYGDYEDEDYPLSTIQDLESIVNYEAQQKQHKEESMFTKDMLISGKHVVEMRDGTRCLVAGGYLIGENDYMPLIRYNNELKLVGALRSLDIVKVFNGEQEHEGTLSQAGAGFYSYISQTELPVVWQRESA